MVRSRFLLLCSALAGVLAWGSLAHAQATTVTIWWTKTSQNELGFHCYRLATDTLPRTKVCDAAAGATTCTATEPPLLNQCYVCTAWNNAGESADSNLACWGVPTAPGKLVIIVG